MIESIKIAKVASYDKEPVILDGLSQFNFFFGSNGTGKTTVSRVIGDEKKYPTCKVTWQSGMRLEPMVYSQDFVERNFNQSDELKGVFTLGEKQVETLAKINEAKNKLGSINDKIKSVTVGLQGVDGNGGKKAERSALEANLSEKCWVQKQKYDTKLKSAFEGYRGSSEKFKDKVLREKESNTSPLCSLAELEKRAETLFESKPKSEPEVPAINALQILTHEINPILKKRIIGKEDVDIAAMIKTLGNSDWVLEGRPFYDANKRVCPFCQQITTEAFAQSLNEYFDETFVADTKAINDLVSNYGNDAKILQEQLDSVIAAPPKFLDIEKLKARNNLLCSKITINNQRLLKKKKEASQVIELETLKDVVEAIKDLIESANTLVVDHNKMVANLQKEKRALTSQVWRYLLNELKMDLARYEKERSNLDKAIASMNDQINDLKQEKEKKSAEIRELQRKITSVQPTIDGINVLLASFGFNSFKLAKTLRGNSYELVRSDGSNAKATLSEGERNFVTFLYFYYLLKGSDSNSGITTDRIVVFDDPVSSLDSDILFIVGSLIKGLFDEVREGTGHIKQIFVLTHNVYFHKEVTFNPKRRDVAIGEETFWVVRKSNFVTKLEKQKSNPIRTSYDLLWAEVRRQDRSNLTIQNTLRRILENYFKILGGINPDKICDMFEGKEKFICKSLFSWVNDGSHFAHDDLYVSIDSAQVENYLKVFHAIFEKSGHLSHYKMMMGNTFEEI